MKQEPLDQMVTFRAGKSMADGMARQARQDDRTVAHWLRRLIFRELEQNRSSPPKNDQLGKQS